MIEARRRAYLQALGVEVWIPRQAAATGGRIDVGEGRGSALLVCAAADDARSEIAADLARGLGDDPVWAWLASDAGAAGETLGDVVASRLITRVLLFGDGVAQALFAGVAPQIAGSALVTVLPALEELRASGKARRAAWALLRSVRGAAAATRRGGGRQ